MRISAWSSDVCSSDPVDLHDRRETVVERAMLGVVAGLRLEGPCYDIGEPIGFAVIIERPEFLEAVDLRLVLGPGRIQALMRFGEIPPRTCLRLLTGDRILRLAGADRPSIGAGRAVTVVDHHEQRIVES